MIGFSVGISEGGRHGTSAATHMRWRARHVDDRAQDRAKDFARKAGAQNWLDSEVTVKFATGTHIAPCAGPVTVADVYQSWFPAQAHISAKTAASRRSAWSGRVEPQWGDTSRSAPHSGVSGDLGRRQRQGGAADAWARQGVDDAGHLRRSFGADPDEVADRLDTAIRSAAYPLRTG
jgi:hypothetical protein